MRARIVVAACLIALVAASASAAATPRQATLQMRACLARSGATKIIRATPYLSAFAYVLPKGVSDAAGVVTIDPGGTAYFGKEHDLHGSWVSWTWVTVVGRVDSVVPSHGRLTAHERRAWNRCLGPFRINAAS